MNNNSLLTRYAENMFWMSRYLERTENLARLLDVTLIFSPASQGNQNWESVLQLHSDTENFARLYPTVDAASVIDFYLLNEKNPNSIISCISHARGDASRLRAIISTEMWVQVNVMYNFIRGLLTDRPTPQQLSELLAKIRRQCQTLSGITEITMYRDQGWYFYLLAKHMERADQTTRILDIKYHLLLPSVRDVGSTIDNVQWLSLLRSVSGYHAFRREHAHTLTPTSVAGFLMLDRRFPRSVHANVSAAIGVLLALKEEYQVGSMDGALVVCWSLMSHLESMGIDQIIATGLHEYLDSIQVRLMQITGHLNDDLFYKE